MTFGDAVKQVSDAIKGAPCIDLHMECSHKTGGKNSRKVVTADVHEPFRIQTYKDNSDQILSLWFLRKEPIFRLDMERVFKFSPNLSREFYKYK